jgi:hypothetical protein
MECFLIAIRRETGGVFWRKSMIWSGKGIDRELLLSRAMLSPATCCLVNPDREKTVERAF